MKKAMFRYKMSLAGYPDGVIAVVGHWLETTEYGAMTNDDKRDAIYEYAIICTDVDKMPLFLRLVDGVRRKSALDYHDSAILVAHIIAGWCK